MSCLSRLGLILSETKKKNPSLDFQLPPVFNQCTSLLSEENERKARDLYCQVFDQKESSLEEKKLLLLESLQLNPFIPEPHTILSQIFLHEKEFAQASTHSQQALSKLVILGTCWDKRISFEGWLAWIRVLNQSAQDQKWVENSFQLLGLGLVK